jgi:hypothetical protein
MKKIILFVCIVILSLSAGTAFANAPDSKTSSDNETVPAKKEVKLSGEELNRLTKRDGEIRSMDSKLSATQEGRHRLRRDRDGIGGDHRRGGGVVYIGGATVLIIILIILLV